MKIHEEIIEYFLPQVGIVTNLQAVLRIRINDLDLDLKFEQYRFSIQ